MYGVVTDWMTAAHTALAAASSLSDAYVSLGPLVTYDDVTGADVVIVGHDDDDESGMAFDYIGEWRDTGANAVHRGQANVYFTVVSQSGGTGLTMAQRITASETLVAAVRAVLLPTPSGSALGVDGVMWSQESAIRAHLLPTAAGPITRTVLTITVACLD